MAPQSQRDAELYALLHRGHAGDVDFYVRRCKQPRTVLELGVGYARVASRLVRTGCHVTGLDRDPGLLVLARQTIERMQLGSRFSAHLGDMQSFELGSRYDRVLIPYSALFCLLDDSAVSECLERCRRHLAPHGRLLLDVYAADGFHSECEPSDQADDEREPIVSLNHDGRQLTVYERSSWDKPRQRLDVHYDYFDQRGDLVHTATIEQRYLLQDQLERHLLAVGLAPVSVHGGFGGEALDSDSETLVIEATLES